MKNSEYWVQRFVQLEEAQNKLGASALADIEKQYKKAQAELEGQIARWYQRFAKNNGITLAEARQWLTGKELKEFKWDVWDYIKYGQENALDESWMKELENASAKYHISKLEAMKIHTRQSFESLFAGQDTAVSEAMAGIYSDGYYHTIYELQKGFNIGWDIAGLDRKKIEKVLSKPWAADGYNFSERIWNNKQKLISEVHNELTQNIMLGQDPQKAIDALAKKMNTSKNNAGRLVMTEEAYFSSLAQGEAFNELDVEQYAIVATLDSRTSQICRTLDGQIFPMKDYRAGVTAPPFHVRCRSTTVPHFDEDFGQIGERAARDEETGKTYYVPDDMTYKDWEKAFVDGGDKLGFVKNIELPANMINGTEMPDDIKNEVKRAIEDIQANYDVKIDEIVYMDISGQGKVPFQFNPINDNGKFKSQFVVNSRYDWNESLDSFNERIYNKNYKAKKLASKNTKNLIAHEMAHFMTFQDCDTWNDFILRERFVRKQFVQGISYYNNALEDGAETIAEGFVALINGDQISEDIMELIRIYVLRWKK